MSEGKSRRLTLEGLCEVVCEELHAHPELVTHQGLRAVTVVLEFQERTGILRNIICRPEFKRCNLEE